MGLSSPMQLTRAEINGTGAPAPPLRGAFGLNGVTASSWIIYS